jgi:hypothetical protein
MKKDNNDKFNSLKNEDSRSKNEVDNLISSISKIKKETDDNLKKLKEEFIKEMKKETDDNLRNLKGEMISSFKEMKKETDDNFKNLKLELASIVNEMKKENIVKLNSLKNEISRSKNDVDNLILLVNENKKGTDDNFKKLKEEIINELKIEMVASFKKLNFFLFGIQNNVHVSKLTESGYSYVYNKPYNHKTTSSEMDEIKKSCLPTTNLCLAGRDSTNDVLLVVSCCLCSVIFTQTAKNTPNLHNGSYWYYTPGLSMGFAPNSTINQSWADVFDLSNNQRLSWHLNRVSEEYGGGWRFGSFTDLYYDNIRYYKVILKRDD